MTVIIKISIKKIFFKVVRERIFEDLSLHPN